MENNIEIKFENNIEIKFDVPMPLVADLLTSAYSLAGYWCRIEDTQKPNKINPVFAGEKIYGDIHYPLSEGGAVFLYDFEDEKRFALDLPKIKTGLQVFATKYPGRFGLFLKGDFDAEDGDVFLQCCLFGDVVYG